MSTERCVFIAPVSEPCNGAWHDLSDFSDLEELETAARESIKLTPDNNMAEELDCPDYEGFGDMFKGNHYVGVGDAWKVHQFFTECEDNGIDAEVVEAYMNNMGNGAGNLPDVSDIQEAYIGEFDSYAALAEQFVDDGLLGEIPEALKNYIDYEAYGRGLSFGDVFENGGHYFWSR